MSPEVKAQLLKSAEKAAEFILDETVAVAEVYAADKNSAIGLGIVNGFKMLRSAFLDEVINKIDADKDA